MASLASKSKRKDGNFLHYDDNLSPSNTLWDTCPLLAIAADPSLAFVYENHFFTFTTGEGGLAATLTESGTAAVITAAAATGSTGCLQLECSDGTVADNDEAYLGSESLDWILGAGKDIWMEWLVKFTEANTDDANVMVGLSSTYAANALQDNGAGPPANYSGVVIFKVDGGTVWQCECAAAASQTTQTSVATRQSGTYQRLGFHVVSNTRVDFYIEGLPVASIANNLPTAAMGLFAGAKNGDTNHEKLYVDYVKIVRLR